VIIEHRTAIGAEGAAETEVVFYSLYMHLSALGRITPAGQTTRRQLQTGDAIWRKDEVGTPGQIYGHIGQIHFEICFDATNLQRIMGREPNWVAPAIAPAAPPAPTADGRTDSIFGSLYFYLPANTPTDAGTALPASHLRRTGGTMLGTAMWVKMSYETGNCSYESFDERGMPIGASWNEANAEYNLYSSATARHNNLPAASQASSSPSGWYELLRFGRNIGRGPATADKDPLPADAAHWRRFIGPGGAPLWVDLNAAGSFKFSDADFPVVMGWNCIDDDTSPADQRCDSANLKSLIRDPDAANTKRMETAELSKRLGEDAVRKQLRRTVCEFPSEWDKGSIATRYAFVKELESFKQSPDAWSKLEAHLNAISFDALPAGYLAAQWRMHPKEFILQMRKCGWLSVSEMTQCFPRNLKHLTGTQFVSHTFAWTDANTRSVTWSLHFNKVNRKYGIDQRQRLTHYFAQVVPETGYLRLMKESDSEDGSYLRGKAYYPYYGRGLIQLTWAESYKKYGEFRRFRITEVSPATYHAAGWNPDTLLVTSNSNYNAANCADSAGYYIAGYAGMIKKMDQGISIDDSIAVCRCVNGNVAVQNINGLDSRLQSVLIIKDVLLDMVTEATSEVMRFTWRRNSQQEPTGKLNKDGKPIKAFIARTWDMEVSLTKQRPQ